MRAFYFRLSQLACLKRGRNLWTKQEGETVRRERTNETAKKEEFAGVPENSFPQICVVSGCSVAVGWFWYKSTEGQWILVTIRESQR
jgi:hypothetical protein